LHNPKLWPIVFPIGVHFPIMPFARMLPIRPSLNRSASAFLLFLAALPLCGAEVSLPGSRKPNVLFIAIDDLKPLLGAFGTPWIHSPAIDRIAARGTTFTANYCQVPLCAPSRVSLLTGLRPDATNVHFNPFKVKNVLRARLPEVVTLPQHFQNQGYITRAMGKVFDSRTVDEGHDGVSWSRPFIGRHNYSSGVAGVRGYQNPETKRRLSEAARNHPHRREPGPPTEREDVPDDAYFDGAMALTAVREIEDLARQPQPFFVAVGFVKPHLPFIAPKKYWDRYDGAAFELASFQSEPLGSPPQAQVIPNSGELRDYSGVPLSGPISEAQQRELIHAYAACVSYIDAQVGLLVQALEQAGVADNTIICLWGDHGWHLGEHGHWGKSTNYEDATRSPLIISAPGVGKGVRTASLSEFLDVYPTLCELAGLPTPSHLAGKSLVPLMRNPGAQLHEAAITQSSTVDSQMSNQLVGGLINENAPINSHMGWTLRTSRYRYIEWRDAVLNGNEHVFGSKPVGIELYDYEKDPLERENLAGKVEYQKVLQEHQDLFDRRLSYLPKRSP
jgi:iduronate 2-sulfatase